MIGDDGEKENDAVLDIWHGMSNEMRGLSINECRKRQTKEVELSNGPCEPSRAEIEEHCIQFPRAV